jgi:hypothetical protein
MLDVIGKIAVFECDANGCDSSRFDVSGFDRVARESNMPGRFMVFLLVNYVKPFEGQAHFQAHDDFESP